MKKRTFQPKRITLLNLIFRSFLVVLVLSLVFAWGFRYYLIQSVNRQIEEQITGKLSQLQLYISENKANFENAYGMQDLSCRMAIGQNYNIVIEEPFSFNPNSYRMAMYQNYNPDNSAVQLVPQLSTGCHTSAALIGQNDNIAASNREILLTHLRFSKEGDPDSGFYVCDNETLQLPEIDQLYEMAHQEDAEHYVDMQITSAYVNKDKRSFIPHEGSMTLYSVPSGEVMLDTSQTENVIEAIDIDITINDDEYELVELHRTPEFPCYMLFDLFGEKREVLDQFPEWSTFQSEESCTNGGYNDLGGGKAVFTCSTPVYISEQRYFLTLRFMVNYRDPQLMKLYWKWTILFALSLTVIAFLWCWRQNVLNKAKYAFEDYQRNLTDHLAHDIKTPLMAISGYAENIIKGSLSDEEQQRYLSSILDNVAFTDSLINRTLFLNHIDVKNTLKYETIQMESLVEEAVQKYALLLREKQITYSISGSAAINADQSSLETIIENLISNAVKYTPENGSINMTLGKKRLIITNTVTEKINTKELKRPFVRGDEARSNIKGSGLGLSIAERAAHINGFTLSLSCTDTIFKAELRKH